MIADYPELIAEVSVRSGRSDVAARAGMFVGMAEAMLSNRLRLARMETVAGVTTDAGGEVPLPADYREMRLVRAGGRVLARRALASVLTRDAPGYAIRGERMVSSRKSAAHELIYYAALPGLEAANTNWLLTEDPEIYLYAVLFQVHAAAGDVEKARVSAAWLDDLIGRAQTADHAARHAGARIDPGRAP